MRTRRTGCLCLELFIALSFITAMLSFLWMGVHGILTPFQPVPTVTVPTCEGIAMQRDDVCQHTVYQNGVMISQHTNSYDEQLAAERDGERSAHDSWPLFAIMGFLVFALSI